MKIDLFSVTCPECPRRRTVAIRILRAALVRSAYTAIVHLRAESVHTPVHSGAHARGRCPRPALGVGRYSSRGMTSPGGGGLRGQRPWVAALSGGILPAVRHWAAAPHPCLMAARHTVGQIYRRQGAMHDCTCHVTRLIGLSVTARDGHGTSAV